MSIGNQLREARERMHLSRADVAASTRSKAQIIEAIERDDFSVFAAPVYGRGFIRLYAQFVGLNPQPLLEEYAAAGHGGAPAHPVAGPEAAAPAAPEPAPATAPAPDPEPVVPSVSDTRAASRTPTAFDVFNETTPAAAPATRPPTPAPPLTPLPPPTVPGLPDPERGLRPDPRREGRRPAVSIGALLRDVSRRWGQALREPLRQERDAAVPASRDPWKLVPIVIGIVVILLFIASGLSKCARSSNGGAVDFHPGSGQDLHLAVKVPDPYFD